MYGALWRILPGPKWLRAIILLLVIAAAVAALMLFVFPWVDANFISQWQNDANTVE